MGQKEFQMDMCHGPLFSKIVKFTIPLMLTFILSIAFNAIDLVVIGHCSSHESMAAIGATLSYNGMLFSLFFGLSVGANVVVAKAFGAKDMERLSKAVHTAILLAFWGGLVLMCIGLASMKPILTLMATPDDIMGKACRYYGICLFSVPFVMIYSFGCTILRAIGDTMRPLFFLIAAGVMNVILNLILVLGFKQDVGGVAAATVASHLLSAVLVLKVLWRTKEAWRIQFRKLHWDIPCLKEILRIGVPAGIQTSCFGLSNMLIQSSINSFGSLAIAGMTAAIGLEGIVQTPGEAFYQTTITFVSQNYGAEQFRRIKTSIFYCYLSSFIVSLIVGFAFYIFGESLLLIFNENTDVIKWGMIRCKYLFTTFALCALMDVASAALRGLGHSMTSMIVTLLGVCIFRIIWIFTIFKYHHTMENLMLSYPISWLLVWLVNGTILIFVFRKIVRDRIGRRIDWGTWGQGVFRGTRAWGNKR